MSESEQSYSMPSPQCLQHCCKIGIAEDKPIDIWNIEKQKKDVNLQWTQL